MPVLGAQPSSQGRLKRGVIIPDGSLDVWKAAKAAHASTRSEVVIFGDSTWYGQGPSSQYSTGNRSPVRRIRERSIAAGYADGGVGMLSYYDSGPQHGTVGDLDPIKTTTGSIGNPSNGRNNNIMGGYGFTLTVGQSVTFQGQYRCARIYTNASTDSGQVTYSMNGTPYASDTPGTGLNWVSRYLSGMPSGQVNEVTVTATTGTARIDFEWLNEVGLTYHRQATPGAQWSTWLNGSSDDTVRNDSMQVSLGGGGNGSVGSTTKNVTPTWRNVKLVMWVLGINDVTVVSTNPAAARPFYNAEAFLQALHLVQQGARGVGADFVTVIPHWNVQGGQPKVGATLRADMVALSLSNGCAVIDSNEAFGGPIGQWPNTIAPPQNAHLYPESYAILGDWVWDNLLAL